MRRPALAALATAALLAATVAPDLGAAGAVPARASGDYGSVRNILPPGSNGTVTVLDVLGLGGSTTATASTPTNAADQLELYDQLTTISPSKITGADIDRLFKDASFTPDTVVSTTTPRDGVTIERDSFGVPFVTGSTFANVEFGAGYASTQDRMFLMDVLRHTGQARLAEFVGNSPSNVAMDQAQLKAAPYTPEEAEAQVQKAADRAGPVGGARLLTAVDSFVEGINAAQDDLCPVVVAPSCPVEYAALQKTPEDWTRADVVYVASLVGGIFGKGGGHEVANAAWYQALKKRFGAAKARRMYVDLREKDDPEAPVTSTRRTPYDGGNGIHPGRSGVALPDVDGPTAPGSGDLADGSTTTSSAAPGITMPDGSFIPLQLKHHGMSNAILVGAKHTTTGEPLAVMGPQTGYYAPQLLTEEVLVGPGIKARGVAFAGTNLFVQLGRGADYAWSATSAGSDNIDTVVERLCNTDGSKPTVESTGYRVGGTCREMDSYIHSETTTPNATAPSLPTTYEFLVLRTRHGVVQQRTTVDGVPVALVAQRSTYGHEVDSVIGFSQFNDPGYVKDARTFQKAASNIDFTFNWFYADDRDISYFSSGLLPLRSAKVEQDFPHWAGQKYDWKGWLPARRHVQETNPARGYFVSWNNKPAPGFSAADDNWSYGPSYRSLALEQPLQKALRRGKVSIEDLVGVMSTGAVADSRAQTTLPWLLKVIGADPRQREAVSLLRSWLADGAPRVDRDRDGAYAHQQAIALFDTWWEDGDASVARDVLRGRLGPLTAALPQGIDDHPRAGTGSAFNGIAWYGYVNKDLRRVLGAPVDAPYSTSYCGRGSLAACRTDLRRSLAGAVRRLLAAQGVEDLRQVTYDKTQDDIRHVTAGLVGVRPIDWQNRPTFQQVVEFTSHRPR